MIQSHYSNEAGVFLSFWKETAFLSNTNPAVTKILVFGHQNLEGLSQKGRVADQVTLVCSLSLSYSLGVPNSGTH